MSKIYTRATELLRHFYLQLKIVKEWEDVKDKYTGKEKEKDANQKIQLTKGKINKIFTKLDEIVVILRDKKSQLYAATTSGKCCIGWLVGWWRIVLPSGYIHICFCAHAFLCDELVDMNATLYDLTFITCSLVLALARR